MKRTPRIPDPGQHVDLRTENGAWRQGFRALSEPWTADTGEVMIWVATEDEYRALGGKVGALSAYRGPQSVFA